MKKKQADMVSVSCKVGLSYTSFMKLTQTSLVIEKLLFTSYIFCFFVFNQFVTKALAITQLFWNFINKVFEFLLCVANNLLCISS